MPKHRFSIKKWWRRLAPNAIWELLKWIGGSTMLTSIGHLISREYHRSPIDWWELAGLMGLGLILVIFGVWRERRDAPLMAESSSSEVTPSGPPDPCAGLFTPLQIDAFRLAKELVPLGRWPGGSLAAFIANNMIPDPKYNEWQRKVVSTYALDFAHRVRSLVLRFGKEGLSEPELEQYFTSIPNAKYLTEIQGRIIGLACRINGIQVEPRVSP